MGYTINMHCQQSHLFRFSAQHEFWILSSHDLFRAMVVQIMLYQITDQILFLTIVEILLLVDLQNGIWIYPSLHGTEDFLRD